MIGVITLDSILAAKKLLDSQSLPVYEMLGFDEGAARKLQEEYELLEYVNNRLRRQNYVITSNIRSTGR